MPFPETIWVVASGNAEDRSVTTANTAASKKNILSRRRSSALVRAPSIQEMSCGSQDDGDDDANSSKSQKT
jgi:hypothetical protein